MLSSSRSIAVLRPVIAVVSVPVYLSLAPVGDRRRPGRRSRRPVPAVNLAATAAGSAAYAVANFVRVEDELAVAVGLEAEVGHVVPSPG